MMYWTGSYSEKFTHWCGTAYFTVLKNCKTVCIAGAMLFSVGMASAESVELQIANVPGVQNDNWSCGVFSAFRALRGGYVQNVSYEQMKSVITPFNPIRVVVTHGIEFGLNMEALRVGQPTGALANSLQNNYRNSAKSKNSANLDEILDLLWTGRPVMVLIQSGISRLGSGRVCLGLDVNGNCYGSSVSVNFDAPTLHWILAVGYNGNGLLYKDTNQGGNLTQFMSWGELELKRAWSAEPHNRQIADSIRRFGISPGDIIYFDEPINRAQVSQDGERFPPIAIRFTGFGRGSVSIDQSAQCETACTQPVRIHKQIRLRASTKVGSTFLGWSGDCSGQDDCLLTMSSSKSVEARFSNPSTEGAIAAVVDTLLAE